MLSTDAFVLGNVVLPTVIDENMLVYNFSRLVRTVVSKHTLIWENVHKSEEKRISQTFLKLMQRMQNLLCAYGLIDCMYP